MSHSHFIEPILTRYLRAPFASEYLVPLYPVPLTTIHTSDVTEISTRVVAVYFPTGGRYSNGEIEFVYAGIRVIP